ncbi:MAG: aldo/keto reductase [Clostridia bacterium]
MQYRKLDKTGEEISALGYGCMRFPTNFGKIDVDLAKEMIFKAIDSGVNYLDTAWFYHYSDSESFLGKHILSTEYRKKVNIATKMPTPIVNKTSQFEEIFNSQQKKLNVDVIDFYLLHTLSLKVYKKMLNLGVIDFMNSLKREKKIRYMGFSFHDNFENFIEIIDSYDWDFCQVQFNILDVNFQAGIKGIEYAKSKGISVFIMEPLRGGSLVSKIPKEVQKIYDTADVKRTPANWALSFVLNHEAITMVLSGMSNLSDVLENVETAKNTLPNSLTKKEEEILTNVSDTFNKLMVVRCTGCKYCLPCPAGIDIPSAFTALNTKNMFPSRLNEFIYLKSVCENAKDGKPSWTKNCINCGKCEKECPQGIDIREKLKLVGKQIEKPIPTYCMSKITKLTLK